KQVYEAIIADLCEKGAIRKRDIRIGIVGRQPVYRSSEKETAQQIEETYRAAGFTAPTVEEARAELRLPVKLFDDLADGLIDQGRIMRIDDRILYHIESVLKARDALKAHFAAHPSVTAAEFRDMLGISRKYAIPLLEFFDKIAFTRREGDIRVLRQKP
ncbi:MAG: SelB domain-containing protein, partial [Armatimonadota bacterium]